MNIIKKVAEKILLIIKNNDERKDKEARKKAKIDSKCSSIAQMCFNTNNLAVIRTENKNHLKSLLNYMKHKLENYIFYKKDEHFEYQQVRLKAVKIGDCLIVGMKVTKMDILKFVCEKIIGENSDYQEYVIKREQD